MTPLLAAGATAALLLLVVAGFQVALAAGAPWGRAAYGGAPDHLPPRLRVTSLVAALVWATAALLVLRRAGVGVRTPLPEGALPAALWVLVALLAVGAVLNLITRSRVERAVWAPVSVVACGATAAVNLLAA
ncbi:hypothetical protein [Kineococcus sp. SYSU DK002]|uniref:hypothetical protein n=1 Tax=Kineococcus sp. SYSU DK002 TaxID=3383123 RepID=UPI003D7D5D56